MELVLPLPLIKGFRDQFERPRCRICPINKVNPFLLEENCTTHGEVVLSPIVAELLSETINA
jgi:hypothetical protein